MVFLPRTVQSIEDPSFMYHSEYIFGSISHPGLSGDG